ncbi:MAG: hypothetical protein IPM79_17340 [Polyangiaceae bacterium]|nr:hypothetical protein [Polyangiaceae bacterium]MBK8939332.1 hypothetical protein [Polyangiaceae bacterium]
MPHRLAGRWSLLVVLAACEGELDGATGAADAGGSGGSTSSHGGSGVGGAGDAGGAGGAAASLVVPEVIAIPYVLAGAGASEVSALLSNTGLAPISDLELTLTGSPLLSLVSAPSALEGGASEAIVVSFAGAAAETIANGTLEITSSAGDFAIPVYAVAGDPALGAASFAPVTGVGAVSCGAGATVSMPRAPFPSPGAPYADDRVRLFVPEGYRERGTQDLVVHFHGHNTTLDATLASHRYEGHLCASGVNAVLVVPQGPVEAASGDFGKLMDPGGLEALARQVLVVLYREGLTSFPAPGDLTLTSHSGGYLAVATNLDPQVQSWPVRQVDLFDSMYGYSAAYVAFAEGGGLLRSNYTVGGGTADVNLSALSDLESDGFVVSTEASRATLRSADPLIYFADTSHNGATRLEGAYGEQLRWGARHHRHGPRVELSTAIASGGSAEVRWVAPEEEDLLGYRIELASGGAAFEQVAEVGPDEDVATFAFAGSGRVRVVPIVAGATEMPSDEYFLGGAADVLVVDGFDRILDGSYGGLRHDFSARVGEAANAGAAASNEAVEEGAVDLSDYSYVVWLTGDESTADRSLSAAEQSWLEAYVAGGGSLVVSGSEIGFELDPSPDGAQFLADVFGAALLADDAGSYLVSGVGSLAGLPSFGYAGASAPYPEDFPDAFVTEGAGEAVLEYATGEPAAVGVGGQAVLVGFPLELVDEDELAAVLAALLSFVE